MLSFYDNYTVCDVTFSKRAVITVSKKNDEILLNFRPI